MNDRMVRRVKFKVGQLLKSEEIQSDSKLFFQTTSNSILMNVPWFKLVFECLQT